MKRVLQFVLTTIAFYQRNARNDSKISLRNHKTKRENLHPDQQSTTTASIQFMKLLPCQLHLRLHYLKVISPQNLRISLCQKKINSRFDRNQMTLENSWSANGDNITEAIATFVHSSGLPFSIVERDAFKNMIETARLQPRDYKIPTRKQIGNQHLDYIYNSVVEANEKKLTKHAEHFGLYFYGDSATIARHPLLNIMAGCGHSSAVVLGIVDATNQYT